MPEVILDALVVSVVADEARPEICEDGIVGNLAVLIVPDTKLDAFRLDSAEPSATKVAGIKEEYVTVLPVGSVDKFLNK